MKNLLVVLFTVLFPLSVNAQTGLKKVYNEEINPIENREKLQQLADRNAYACLQLQLRKGDNVVFETRLTA